MTTYYIVQSRVGDWFPRVASHENKAEAIRLALEACPDETLFCTKIVDGEEAGTSLVGKLVGMGF